MTDYTKADCPVCKKDFSAARPVICPDCGAPYHRECWAVSGHCSFEAAHKTGFVWSMPVQDTAAFNPPPEPQPIRDGFFGDINITFDRQSLYDKTPPPDQRFIYGVSEKEIACFQGNQNPLKFMKYRKLASGDRISQRISFNIFAAFFSPLYFFYSRMRVAGVIVAMIIFLLRLPVLIEAGGSLGAASYLFTLLGFGFQILLALFFDYFYLLWMVAKIKFIRSDFLDEDSSMFDLTPPDLSSLGEDYYTALRTAGKPGFVYILEGAAVTVFMTLIIELIRTVV